MTATRAAGNTQDGITIRDVSGSAIEFSFDFAPYRATMRALTVNVRQLSGLSIGHRNGGNVGEVALISSKISTMASAGTLSLYSRFQKWRAETHLGFAP